MGLKTRRSKILCTLFVAALLVAVSVFSLPAQPASAAVSDSTVPCTIETYGNAWDGNLTFGLFHYDPNNSSRILESYLVNMKTSGELLNLREYPDSGANYVIVKYISQDTVMFQGEPAPTTHFWNLVTNQTEDFPNVTDYHHDICYNPVNGTFLVLQNYVRDVGVNKVLYDKIVELNSTGGVLWQWDTYDHFPLSWVDQFNITDVYKGETVMDFTHCNDLIWDYAENVVYLNSRHLDTFFKINMTSGDVIWSCGKHGDFALLDANGNPVTALWWHSHATQEIAPNVFIMFNNDYDNETNPNDHHSSILIFKIDENNMTAQELWNWEAPEEYWTSYWGKADVLPNGDRIGTFGTPAKLDNDSIGAVIVEVNPQGDVVRTWTFPNGWGIYRVVEGEAGGQVPNEYGIYSQAVDIPEFSSPLAIVIIATMTTATIIYVRFYRKKKSSR
jgi:hypothetical protein